MIKIILFSVNFFSKNLPEFFIKYLETFFVNTRKNLE